MTRLTEDLPPGLIAVPATHWMPSHSAESFAKLMPPAYSGLRFLRTAHGTAHKRNLLAEEMLHWHRIEALPQARRLEWVLFLDSDMVFPSDIAQRLLKVDADIAAGCFVTRGIGRDDPKVCALHVDGSGLGPDPLRPTEGREIGAIRNLDPLSFDPEDDPFEVGAVGTAATLIHRRVFEEVPRPWFVEDRDVRFSYLEDVNFCIRATRAGFRVKMAPRLRIVHVGQYPYDLNDARMRALALNQVPEQAARGEFGGPGAVSSPAPGETERQVAR